MSDSEILAETTPPAATSEARPYTDYALAKLRALAKGNGLDPARMKVNQSEEKEVSLTGIMTLAAKAEQRSQDLVGKGIKLPRVEKSFTHFSELIEYVAEEQRQFTESTDWYDEVMADLDKLPGKGWGLEQARIIFDNKPDKNFSASETCTRCFGAGTLTCEFCAGKGYTPCPNCYERGVENCYFCFGSGVNPQDNNLPCPTCNGTRLATCRTCQGRKGLVCGNCHANGTLMCPPCQGGGKMTQLITLSYGAEASFALGGGADLPSALRRAMERQGGVKILANGHAAIDYSKPTDEEKKPGRLQLIYTAKLRCADIAVQFGDEAKRIAIFGDKKVLLEVPAFLDKSLDEPLQQLRAVARGKGDFKTLLATRIFKELCTFLLEGKPPLEALRKEYPLGLSRKMMEQLITAMRGALARQTMAARWVGLLAAFVLTLAMGGALYQTPLHSTLLTIAGKRGTLLIELFVPLFCATIGYIITGQAARFHLQHAFPKAKLAMHQPGGWLAATAALLGLLIPFGLSLLQPGDLQWLTLVQ